MQLELSADQRAFRDELASWLAANVPRDLPPPGTPDGFGQHVAWERQLVAAGYAAIHWPVEYGGRGAGPVEQAIFEAEYLHAGGPERVTVLGHNLLGPTLMRHGTDEQQQRFLPGILDASTIWAQGYSEPDAGSDLAAIKTRAVRDGDEFVVTGQKIWTSYGAYADWLFALVRTDPDAPKHAGITFLVLPLDSPGIEVRPIRQLDGHAGFAEVFLTDVRVPVGNVVGRIDDGWRVAMTALEFERDAPAAAPTRYHRDLGELVAIARARGLTDDDVVRDELARLAVAVQTYEHHAERTLAALATGADLGPLSSVTKLAWSELERDLYTTGRELLGAHGDALDELPGVTDPDGWRTRYWYARAATIYAGTSEIQRGIIAQRVLGLPRRPGAAPRDMVAPPLDAAFTDEQVALRDVARELFTKANPPSRLREMYEGGDRGPDLWRRLVEIGLTAIGVPERCGGVGGDLTDLTLVLEEAGRAAVPEPVADTLAVATPILAAASDAADVADAWLARIATGEATVGFHPADHPTVEAHGHAALVVEADGALHLVEDPPVTQRRAAEDASRPLLRLAPPNLDAATRLGGADLVARARTLAAAATAAELVGVCDHLLTETVAYAKLRRQFDTPIGAFQAVAHELASMFVALESARGAVHDAVRRIAAGDADAAHAAHVAKAAANHAARRIETSALQLHGGIGFTWEHDLHLWLKRALALQTRHGDTRTHRRGVARTIIDARTD